MGLITNNVEILSIHIPKTGGSSFQQTLQSLYGASAFQRLDFTVRQVNGRPRMIATNRTCQKTLDKIYNNGELPADIRVLRGHFHYEDIARFFHINSKTRVVTWLRDPIQRIVSNYHYLIASFEREVQHTPLSERLFKRLVKSLSEFARNKRDTSLYSDYLRGRELGDYAFVGVIEEYEQELSRLAKVLCVPEVPYFNVNKAGQKAPALALEEELTLIALNENNLEIYREALSVKAH